MSTLQENKKRYEKFKEEEILQFVKNCNKFLRDKKMPFKNPWTGRRRLPQYKMIVLCFLKEFLDVDYRSLISFVESNEQVKSELKMKTVPHYSTVHKFKANLEEGYLEDLFKKFVNKDESNLAIDSSHFSDFNSDVYYRMRVGKITRYSHSLKTSVVVDTRSQYIVSASVSHGICHDSSFFLSLLNWMEPSVNIQSVAADAAYDSEINHRFVITKLNADSLIKVRKIRQGYHRKGRYRRKIASLFNLKGYRKKYNMRSIAECVFSVIKRCFSRVVKSFKSKLKKIELMFRLLAYNIRRMTILNTKVPC